MARRNPRRRRASTAAGIALTTIAMAVLALAACGAKENPAGSTGDEGGGDTQIGGAPSASSLDGNPSGGATPTTGGAGGNSGPTYPKDAKAYAQEVLKAWAKPDYTRLGQLAIQAAVQQVRDSINFGGNPNASWTYVKCGPGEQNGFAYCVFRNSHGDETTIKLDNTQLGFPTAVTEVPLTRTQYPNDPVSYVNNLLGAHADGNLQRVLRLSSETVKSMLSCTFGHQANVSMIDGTHSKVTFDGLGVDLGKKYEFKVLTVPGGKANAVKEVLTKQC